MDSFQICAYSMFEVLGLNNLLRTFLNNLNMHLKLVFKLFFEQAGFLNSVLNKTGFRFGRFLAGLGRLWGPGTRISIQGPRQPGSEATNTRWRLRQVASQLASHLASELASHLTSQFASQLVNQLAGKEI